MPKAFFINWVSEYQIHDLRNGHCGACIWYEIYGRCSDFLTLRWVGIWEIEASVVERLFKSIISEKNILQNYQEHLRTFCKIETGEGGGGGNFQVVSQRQNMSKCFFAHTPKVRKKKKLGSEQKRLNLYNSSKEYSKIKKLIFCHLEKISISPPPFRATLCLQNIKKCAFLFAYFPTKMHSFGVFKENFDMAAPPPVSRRQNMSFFFLSNPQSKNIKSA